jgi:hypothetical protein
MAVLSTLSVVALLLLPTGASARRVSASGSLTISPAVPASLANQLVATVLVANTSLDSAVKQGLPRRGGLYVSPFFVNFETTNPLPTDLDTLVILTNTTATTLSIFITVRANNGDIIASVPVTLTGNETRTIRLSNVLP